MSEPDGLSAGHEELYAGFVAARDAILPADPERVRASGGWGT